MRIGTQCDTCTVPNGALCRALPVDAALRLSRIAHFRRLPAGRIIHSDHQDLTYYAIIVSGVVKLVKSKSDGRQQIVGLQFPTDFVGRPFSTRSTIVAEATTDLDLCCFSKNTFETLMGEHPPLERAVFSKVLDDLDACREWMFLLGRKTARERLASLLVLIAERIAQPPSEIAPDRLSRSFDLPLSRNEMADTLGLTLETVCREMGHFKSQGLIAGEGRRRVTTIDLPALRTLADGDGECA